jgi:hypothetical protein
MVWYGVIYMIWYGMIYDMVWYDIYDMVWYDIWYGMVWYGMRVLIKYRKDVREMAVRMGRVDWTG